MCTTLNVCSEFNLSTTVCGSFSMGSAGLIVRSHVGIPSAAFQRGYADDSKSYPYSNPLSKGLTNEASLAAQAPIFSHWFTECEHTTREH
jgi:hypothetical protein